MSPSHSCHSSPALSDDDIVSVFLRIPPDDPARLVRASLVCKDWRRILTGPDFCRLYRVFHGTPPMIGFAVNFWPLGEDFVSRFISTTSFRLPAGLDPDHRNWKAVDSRHGRILVELVDEDALITGGYIVRDPITNGRWGVPMPRIDGNISTAAVLCAKEHCDHLGCHGPPFLVAMVSSDYGAPFACVYSSESGVWSDIITLNCGDEIDSNGRSILMGNTLYFPFTNYNVLQYNLGEQKLSVIDVPVVDTDENLMFISVEDDMLFFVGLGGTRLSLWSTQAGAPAWAKRTVIDLEKLLPPRALCSYRRKTKFASVDENGYGPHVSGFAQGTVFLSTIAGLFTIELESGRTKKVAEVELALSVKPWMSFYTQDHARRMMPRR